MLADNLHVLTPLFFGVAIFYSMVGFGGGSSYIALLILAGLHFTTAPILALICNLIVVAGGTFHFYRTKSLSVAFLLPFVVTSIPFAYLGGLIPLSKETFQILLGFSLLVASARMLFYKKPEHYDNAVMRPPLFASLLLGSALGLLSGMVGIGGGIFLAPILYLLNWGKPKTIAATASGFIFVNSLAGLVGQIQKVGHFAAIQNYWPLLLAVFIGGQIGSTMVNYKISHRRVEVLTSVLILIVSCRLLLNSLL